MPKLLQASSTNPRPSIKRGRAGCNYPVGLLTHATTNNLSNGTDTQHMARQFTHLSDPTCDTILPVFGAWSGNDTDIPSFDLTVWCSVEQADGTILPFTFAGGNASGTLKPGGTLTPDDPVTFGAQRVIGAALNTGVYLRMYVSCAAGGKWPANIDARLFGASEQSTSGTSVTNLTFNGSAALSGGTAGNQFGPILVLGNGTIRKPAVGLIGDSQSEGSNDLPLTYGYITRALRDLGFGQVKLSRGSETASDWTVRSRIKYRLPLLEGCTHIIQQHATNDLVGAARTPAQLRADLLTAAKLLAPLGARIYLTTCTPRTDSGNTTRTITQADLSAHNSWVRDGAPIDSSTLLAVNTGTVGALRMGQTGNPWVGYLDVNSFTDAGVDTGLWAANRTSDGIHPGSSTNIAAMYPTFRDMISGWTA